VRVYGVDLGDGMFMKPQISRQIRFTACVVLGGLSFGSVVTGSLIAAVASTIPACTANQLNAIGGRQGEATTAAGNLEIVNVSAKSCSLKGKPSLLLLKSSRLALPHITYGPLKEPMIPVLLPPKGEAELITNWANWCHSPPGALKIRLTLPRGAGSLIAPFDGPPAYNYVPLCINKKSASVFTIAGGYHSSSYILPNCSITNFTASSHNGGAAAGTHYEQISLVNRGPICTLVRVGARGYNSKTLTVVGLWAKYLPTNPAIYKSTKVGLVANGGQVHVTLGIETAMNYPAAQCKIAMADAVRLAEMGTLSKTITVKLNVSTPVCTKIQSLQIDWPKIG
jgi:hypothetical protein